jgi:type IX secretion system PorP/SprF family membrane protein
MRKWSALLFLLFIAVKTMGQQDPIFTQYMNNIQSVNPAYAGIWSKTGFISLVRKQWLGIDKSPFTQMVSFHTPTQRENVGLGLNIINDTYSREKRLSIFGDYSYEVLVTPEMQLRMGLKFGFMNYQNPLTKYRLIDDQFDPAFQEDIDLQFLPNFGVGFFLYQENFYISLSMPKLIKNDFKTNRNNYSTMGEIRNFYLSTGYVFDLSFSLKFKPTLMMRASLGLPVQVDLGANFLLNEKLWLGTMVRTGDAICFLSQWIIDKHFRIGYAMDVSFNEIYKHQNGTYEFTLSYDMDFFGRNYVRSKYF